MNRSNGVKDLGGSIVLAAKFYQEHIENIDDLVWRKWASYRKLNAATKPFELPNLDTMM